MAQYEWVNDVKDKTEEPSRDIFVHVKAGPNRGDWLNIGRRFLRVPCVGEVLALHETSPLFRVTRVVHCPFDAQFGAEIYCVPLDIDSDRAELLNEIWPES